MPLKERGGDGQTDRGTDNIQTDNKTESKSERVRQKEM